MIYHLKNHQEANFRLFIKHFKREFLIQIRQIRLLINFCLFFLIFLFIFPLTLKPEIAFMREIAPGLLWAGILLALLLSAERLFQPDYEQGLIEQWLVSGQSLFLMTWAKIFAHWILTLLSIVILIPIIALLFSFSLWETWVLLLSFLCGTPALFFLCALASSFGIGINQKGALVALILFPLTLPVLIFGSATLYLAMHGLAISAYLALLLAMSLVAAGFLPYAIASIIRISYID